MSNSNLSNAETVGEANININQNQKQIKNNLKKTRNEIIIEKREIEPRYKQLTNNLKKIREGFNFEDLFDREIVIIKNKKNENELIEILKLRIKPKGNLENQLLLSKLLTKINRPNNSTCQSINISSVSNTIDELKNLVLCGKINNIDEFLERLLKINKIIYILQENNIILPNINELNENQKKYLIKFLVLLPNLMEIRNNYNLKLAKETNSEYYNLVKNIFKDLNIIDELKFNENLYIYKTILGKNEQEILKSLESSNQNKINKINLVFKMLLKPKYTTLKSRCNKSLSLEKNKKFFGLGTKFRQLTNKENYRNITIKNNKISWTGTGKYKNRNREIPLTKNIKFDDKEQFFTVTQANGTCHKFRLTNQEQYNNIKQKLNS